MTTPPDATAAMRRTTLRDCVRLEGIGLFSARPVRVAIHPASGGGIWFRRTDLPGQPACRATVASLSTRPVHPAFARMAPRSTTLQTPSGDLVATTEHVLSALVGVGVTDARIDLDGLEVPLMDASSLVFVEAIRAVGVREGEPLRQRVLPHPIEVRDGEAWARATPRESAGCSFRYDLDYDAMASGSDPDAAASAAWLGRQSALWDGSAARYASEIAPARTFCLRHEADAMRSAGLLTHLRESDALVIGPDGPIGTTQRLEHEPARHKLLDLIGDLALVGDPVRMDVHASRGGHALNHRLARAILDALGD
ncbi:MAG: UDP-3-O-acyl-N-acetylglucosamine deacetylase [Phycisphaerales bacterium]|nr:UDP-3-O-acyl-N-acetylglucosamine deacetylase [Phycisphaerales bacterium]MCB9840809.1 UDP-3-O-acyl-N-acetylglucosamine deacetylase [Phycisphaeraceae bacterium]